jgi:hypothetical protein
VGVEERGVLWSGRCCCLKNPTALEESWRERDSYQDWNAGAFLNSVDFALDSRVAGHVEGR